MRRKLDPELGAGLAIARVDARAHCGRQLPHEGEPYAGTDGFACQLVFGAVEELEDFLELRLRHAWAVVADGEQHGAVSVSPGRDLDLLYRGVRREFQRVVDQVDEDLRGAVDVDDDARPLGRLVAHDELEPGALDL